jgi:hypothetical protein
MKEDKFVLKEIPKENEKIIISNEAFALIDVLKELNLNLERLTNTLRHK